MKRFFGILAILIALFVAVPGVMAADDMRIFTVELYDADNAYIAESTATGGVITSGSGTSDWTWTAKGQFENTTDHRTIDLSNYAPDAGTITFQLVSHPDEWDGGLGPDSGVSLYDGTADGSNVSVQVKFSAVDNATAWSGASPYQIVGVALSGNTTWSYEINHDDTGVVFQRYMRLYLTTGGQMVCPQGVVGVLPK